MTSAAPPRKPWYREPWPWLLMAGPALVVVAGIVTAWLAVSSSDGLVTDDYYKKGLAIDQTLARSERARVLGIEARLTLTGETLSVGLHAGAAAFAAPDRLVLSLSHPTRAGLDQTQLLAREGGRYVSGQFRLPASGHWLVSVEDERKTWRLLGNVVLPAPGEIVIGAGASADFRNQ